ncbi:Protein of unknown function [Salinihabitans flavidus]|uniref:DUF3592 domain-containing protein n=1 Tax=Salinihabitans flavidus TaxID=569882 RepID=A0A1H8RXS6_9RHOB|nr:DUF3592 domain-containing protein [Salinihabitans flavidus]SEO70723.1 Protein of unknown function [Salinihabitans flavidus]
MARVARTEPVPIWRLFLRMGGWFTLIFAAVAVILTLIGSRESTLAKRFETEGRTATATVMERSTTTSRDSDGNRSTTYYLSLRFETRENRVMNVRRSVKRGIYSSVAEGDTLPVWYLPSDPDTVAMSENEKQASANLLQMLSLGFGALTLGMLWYSGHGAVAAVRARRFGRRETATVTGLKRTNTQVNKKYRYRLTWRERNGRVGESLMYPREALEDIPEGSEIAVYQGLKRAWWTGDVGERRGRG